MKRRREPEIMDDPSLAPAEHRRALKALNRANRWLGVDRGLYRGMLRLVGETGGKILDLGSGGGGFLRYAAERSNGRTPFVGVGLDVSPQALGLARDAVGDGALGVAADARRLPFGDNAVNIVTCSLFLHHFCEDDVVVILREAARVARCGIVIGDLTRSRPALALTWLATRLLSRSRVFHVDGPRSVRAAFRPEELADLSARAGLDGASLETKFPFRMLITWSKPEEGHGAV